MSSQHPDERDHCMEMVETPVVDVNHQDHRASSPGDKLTAPGTRGANSGYDSDQADEVASNFSRTDLNRPGGPYTSGPVKHDPLPPPQGNFYKFVHNTQNDICSFWDRHKKLIKRIVLLLMLIGYFVYLTFAILRDVKEANGLIAATVLFCLYFTYKLLLEKRWQNCRVPCCHREWWQSSRCRSVAITTIKW